MQPVPPGAVHSFRRSPFVLHATVTPDVIFTLTGPITRNSRALKQLDALDAQGLTVLALGIGTGAPGKTIRGERITIHTLPRPEGSGPAFFWRVHQLFQRALRTREAAVYHASDLYTLPTCAQLAKKHNSRLVYDARECYAHVASTQGRPWVSWFWKYIEGRHIRQADAVFTVSPSIVDFLAKTHGIQPPTLLHNVPPMQSVPRSNLLRTELGIPEKDVIVLHQGNIQRDRGCFALTKAMQGVNNAVLVFLGDGPLRPALESFVQVSGIGKKVRFLDAVPPDELLAYTASADVGVTLLEDTCLNHQFALPNKLFEYLMAGLPVLASDLTEIHRVVADHQVGVVVPPGDVASIAAGLQSLVDHPQQRAACAAQIPQVFETFNWETAYENFVASYLPLLHQTV